MPCTSSAVGMRSTTCLITPFSFTAFKTLASPPSPSGQPPSPVTCSPAAPPPSLPKNRTRDGEPLNFRGALIQFRDSLVPVQLLDDVVLDESVPAMDLDRVGHGPVRGLAREQLRRARLVRVLNAAGLHPRGSGC